MANFPYAAYPRPHRPARYRLAAALGGGTLAVILLGSVVDLPAFRSGAWLFTRFRVFQQGSIQAYLLYLFLTLLALLLWQ